jgi:hypothetical protein
MVAVQSDNPTIFIRRATMIAQDEGASVQLGVSGSCVAGYLPHCATSLRKSGQP